MQNSSLLAKDENVGKTVIMQTKVYKRRWYILLVFFYYAFMNAVQMTEYSSITEIVSRYYNVSHFAVNWTSLLYMILYPVFVIPASYIIETKGLRVASLCGCFGTVIGTTLKMFSLERNEFWIVILGQFFNASSLSFIMCLPPKIAAVWFKPSEISIACSLGTLGPNIGNAFGYLITVSIVKDSQDFDTIGSNLKTLCYTLSILVVPVALAVFFYFPEKPSLPPSMSQARNYDYPREITFSFLKNVRYSKGFFLHLLAYATNLGVLSTMMVLLSEFVIYYFPGAAEDAGRMGFCMMIFGIVGCIFSGIYLDKTHKYKATCIFIFFLSTLSVILLTIALEKQSLVFAYVMCGIFGIFINPLIPVGFDFGIELTYPSDESTVAGLLFAASQIMSVIFGIAVAYINAFFGTLSALITLAVLLGLGTLLELCVPNKMERQKAFQNDAVQT